MPVQRGDRDVARIGKAAIRFVKYLGAAFGIGGGHRDGQRADQIREDPTLRDLRGRNPGAWFLMRNERAREGVAGSRETTRIAQPRKLPGREHPDLLYIPVFKIADLRNNRFADATQESQHMRVVTSGVQRKSLRPSGHSNSGDGARRHV